MDYFESVSGYKFAGGLPWSIWGLVRGFERGMKMDGHRIQQYWSHEMEAMLETYRQFEILIPAKAGKGAAHRGEDGRYVETLIREY